MSVIAPNGFALDDRPSLYKAVKAFLLTVIQPELAEDQILAGNTNRMVLPKGNDYVIVTPLLHLEHGTPVTTYSNRDEGYQAEIRRTIEVVVQVDFYSDSHETARLRAETLHTVAQTTLACDLLRPFGFSACYADPPRDMTAVLDANIFVPRWTTSLHLMYTHRVTASLGSFGSVSADIFNVDVKYPPKPQGD